MSRWTRSIRCLCTLPRQLCDWSSAVCRVVLGMTVSDPQSRTKTVIKAVSLRPIFCHSFRPTSTQIKCFLLSLLPPLEPSRGKSVKLEVEEDKSTKGSNPTPTPAPPEVVISLSPYTFPQEWPFHAPEEENIPGKGVHLAGLLHSSQPGCYRNKGSSVGLDSTPVPPMIREAWNTNKSPHTACPVSQCRAARPPNQTNRTAILKACQYSSENV